MADAASSKFVPLFFTHPISSKLDQNNFIVCRKQVLATIRGHQLQNYLFGSIPPPAKFLAPGDEIPGRINPDYLDWEQKGQLILSWLLASMSDSILTRMVNCDSSVPSLAYFGSLFCSTSSYKGNTIQNSSSEYEETFNEYQ